MFYFGLRVILICWLSACGGQVNGVPEPRSASEASVENGRRLIMYYGCGTYRAADGQPLLRLTFDGHPNAYNMHRFIIAQMKEVMTKMGPTKMAAKDELEPFNIHDYSSTPPTGGAVMGTDPGNSICNKYGQVWDTPNVFVTNAALFPQNPGANPTDTVAALAYMTGDAIREKYCKEPNRIIP